MTRPTDQRLAELLRLGAGGERALAEIQPSGLPSAPLIQLAQEMDDAADELLRSRPAGEGSAGNRLCTCGHHVSWHFNSMAGAPCQLGNCWCADFAATPTEKKG